MVISDAVRGLQRELARIFGSRLESLSIYGARDASQSARHDAHAHGADDHSAAPTRTLAVIASLTADDLRACSALVESWHDAGLATPLLIGAGEFERSLDAFPLEFGAILADHLVVSGRGPFDGVSVDPADMRRACEVQARSHLIHLREGFLETRGNGGALAVLIVRSAPAFAGLVAGIARLDGHDSDDRSGAARHVERLINVAGGHVTDVTALAGVHDISSDEAARIFPAYLEAVQRLVTYVDTWSAR
jgi:hypothetical protein